MSTNLNRDQQHHWQSVYTAHPEMYGWHPSEPARYAAELFGAAGASSILELGAGHGRDAMHFAREGFTEGELPRRLWRITQTMPH